MKTKLWMTLMVFSVMAGVLAGCSDAPGKAAGKTMYKAVNQASVQLRSVQGLIDNPPPTTKETKVEFGKNLAALAALDKIESDLKAVLKAEYTDKKSNEDPDATSEVDAALVRRALGGVYSKRGQFYLRQMENERAELYSSQSGVQDLISSLLSHGTALTLASTSVSQIKDESASLRRDATAQRARAEKAIADAQDAIVVIRAEIKSLNDKAAVVMAAAAQARMKSREANNRDAQLTLRQAQALDAKAAGFAFDAEKKQATLLVQRSLIQSEQLKVTASKKIIATAAKMKANRASSIKSLEDNATSAKADIATYNAICSKALAKSDTHLANVQTLAEKAIAAYTQSADWFEKAVDKTWKKDQAQVLHEQADSLAYVAAVQAELFSVRKCIEMVNQQLDTTWTTMGSSAPVRPQAPKATAFLAATAKQDQTVDTAYAAAIVQYKEAAEPARCGESREWAFKATLAGAYLDYAATLKTMDNAPKATEQTQAAKALWGTIQSGAEVAGRLASIQSLQKRLGMTE
ncbi:MAG: hypothetical protein HN370_06910 [Phycisphaerales bacterium]|nr:hypothetical protein [Phycisphaerales bacterium]